MGSGYSVRHAAVLAEQLPVSSRCKSRMEPDGLMYDELLAVMAEYNTRLLTWQVGNMGAERPSERPAPLFDFCVKVREGSEAMEIDELIDFLAKPRTEVRDGQ